MEETGRLWRLYHCAGFLAPIIKLIDPAHRRNHKYVTLIIGTRGNANKKHREIIYIFTSITKEVHTKASLGNCFFLNYQKNPSIQTWWKEWSHTFTAVCLRLALFSSVQLLSHVWLLATPWTVACQASLSVNNSQSLLKLMSLKLVMPSNHLILCHPLLLLPSNFLSVRVFSKESVLRIR